MIGILFNTGLNNFLKHLKNQKSTYVRLMHLDNESKSFKNYLKSSKLKLSYFPEASGKILVDIDIPASNSVALIHFLPHLMDKFQSNCEAYIMRKNRLFVEFKESVKFKYSILRMFGIKSKICVVYDKKVFKKSHFCKNVATVLLNEINNHKDLQNLVVQNLLVGDLLYDYILNRNRLWTIDLKAKEFKDSFYEFMFYLNFWNQYFANNKVLAVCVGHSVYHYGIPARIAADKDIEVFQVDIQAIYRLTREFPFTFTRSEELQHDYSNLKQAEKELGLKIAEQRLIARFNGEYSDDVPWSSGSVFARNLTTGYFQHFDPEKLKVLVATHHFYDAPHFHGIALYEDFLIWIERLLVLSKKCDYQWFIKVHPNASAEEYSRIESLISEFQNFHLLPADITHYEILENGVEFALTMYGTIGLEYAYHGKTVINACPNHPSSSYKFTLTPKSVQEYEKIILDLKNSAITPSKKEILEFYFMSHVWHLKSWIVKDYTMYLKSLGGYNNAMTNDAYKILAEPTNLISSGSIKSNINIFLNSAELRLSPIHATPTILNSKQNTPLL